MIDNATPYKIDLPLFKKLGLKPFNIQRENFNKDFLLGVIITELCTITIVINCSSAQVFRFLIHCFDTGRVYEISTGSGSLSDFWPSIELLAKDMIVIKQIMKTELKEFIVEE